MKKITALFLTILIVPALSAGENLDIEIVRLYRDKYHGELTADVMLTNNSGEYIDYCEVTVVIIKGEKMVAAKSRPFTNLPTGGFYSKTFRFNYRGEGDKYRYSISNIRYGN